jgi:unsaturated rhamnogalacturonyl hydrolase
MLATAALLSTSTLWAKGREAAPYAYQVASVTGGEVALPEGKYIPFDWAFREIAPAGPGIKLSWPKKISAGKESVRLRLTSATDVREEVILEVKTANSGKVVGQMDLRFAHYMQPFELVIPSACVKEALAEGVTIQLARGTKPFWFFSPGESGHAAPTAFLPSLLTAPTKPESEAWKDRLLSLDSVQTFGWMQGVVWDGLYELSKQSPRAKTILAQQLDLYFGNNSLVYANLNNVRTVGKISTVESILPFAILAQTHPTHALLQTAVNFCRDHANAEGVIGDGSGNNRMLKTEECYTVSYPLAVLAKTLNQPELTELAIRTLQARVALLDTDAGIYQRGKEQGELYFENWGRGVAWYLLGLVKTLVHLPESSDKDSLKKSLNQAVNRVLSYQQPNGLWYCFLHQADTQTDTSGSAGIAAALHYGYRNNLLPKNASEAARRAYRGLTGYFTPDGYLTGTAQVNKGGDALQLGGFRVMSPYTLGFLAHLT